MPVQSDPKPLEVIFKRPLVTAPKRLQRMLLRLQRYSLEVTFVRGSEMYIADTLSQAYTPAARVITQSRSQRSTWLKDCQCLPRDCRTYEMPLIVFYRNSSRLPHKSQTLTLMCALTITCSSNWLCRRSGLQWQQNCISDRCSKRHNRHGSPISPGPTWLHSSGKGCRVLVSDEPTNHRLRQPVLCV